MRLRYNQTVNDVGGRETKTFLLLEINLLLACLLTRLLIRRAQISKQ